MAIYKATVTLADEKTERLVEAKNEVQVLRHVAKTHIKIEPVRSSDQIKDMAALAAKGVTVEQVTAD